MNLYLITQVENNGYDTYDSAVVAAMSEDDARKIHPDNNDDHDMNERDWAWVADRSKVTVQLIGIAVDGIERGVIVASFNAG